MKKIQAILVDDEYWGLKRLEHECAAFEHIEVAGQFRSGTRAIEYARQNPVDVAFLDVEMPDMSGYEVSARLRALQPGITVVYASAGNKEDWTSPHAATTTPTDPPKEFYIEKPCALHDVAEVLSRADLL